MENLSDKELLRKKQELEPEKYKKKEEYNLIMQEWNRRERFRRARLNFIFQNQPTSVNAAKYFIFQRKSKSKSKSKSRRKSRSKSRRRY